eukprot:scaffold106129_cov47-Attheya_sp.AAC.1
MAIAIHPHSNSRNHSTRLCGDGIDLFTSEAMLCWVWGADASTKGRDNGSSNQCDIEEATAVLNIAESLLYQGDGIQTAPDL